MSRRWKIFGYCGGYVISALNTLVGLALALIYDSHSWRWRDGCIEVIGGVKWTRSKVTGQLDVRTRIWFHPRAQTHGIVKIFATKEQRDREDLNVHENCHVVHAFLLGPLFMLLWGLDWLVNYVLGLKHPKAGPDAPRWWHAYRRILFERQAFGRQAEFQQGLRPNAWGARR